MISSKNHKSRKAAVVAALAAGCVGVTLPMHGATVTATCSTDQSANSTPGQYGTITASGDTSAQCEFFVQAQGSPSSRYVFVDALGRLTLTVAANPADYSRFTTYQELSSRPGPPDINHHLGTASSARTQLNFNDKFTTAGTPRLGFLQMVFAATSDRLDANGQLTTGIATQGLPAGQTEFTCMFTNSGTPCIFTQRPSNPYLLPFELGTTFYLQALGGGLAISTQGIPSSGSLSTDYQFRFLEADGVTPVKVSEMPEPGNFTLVGLLVLGALGAWKRKKRAAAELTKENHTEDGPNSEQRKRRDLR